MTELSPEFESPVCGRRRAGARLDCTPSGCGFAKTHPKDLFLEPKALGEKMGCCQVWWLALPLGAGHALAWRAEAQGWGAARVLRVERGTRGFYSPSGASR